MTSTLQTGAGGANLTASQALARRLSQFLRDSCPTLRGLHPDRPRLFAARSVAGQLSILCVPEPCPAIFELDTRAA